MGGNEWMLGSSLYKCSQLKMPASAFRGLAFCGISKSDDLRVGICNEGQQDNQRDKYQVR